MRLKIGLAGGALLCAVSGADPIVPVSQYRGVDVEGYVHNAIVSGVDQDEESRTAYDFGLFDRSVTVDVSVGTMYSGASSSQQSLIAPWLVAAVGSTSVSLGDVLPDSAAQAMAESSLEFVFDLLAPSTVRFDAQVSALNDLLGVDLYSADFSFWISVGWGLTEEAAFAGVLMPGRYVISAFGQTYLEGYPEDPPQTAVASWGLRFQIVPGPGVLAVLAAGGMAAARRRR
ncbi:MAG: hypothetical protein KF866_01945 [Phycisphaeraceae bacterium]|nr:hypothetical protein [Phycisphaeraceae bacterium]MCW5753545.1 hypothetical protein [Phycisphaeraceae bacterium]